MTPLFRTPIILLLVSTLASSCHSQDASAPLPAGDLTIAIVNTFPHPGPAFTQGLIYDEGLVESSGGYAESYLQRYQPGSASADQKKHIDKKYFAEGLVRHADYYYLLSWREGKLLQLQRDSLELVRTLDYRGEGWGLTSDGDSLIMSNGSDEISFRDPADLSIRRSVRVRHHGKPVPLINELEWVNGLIFANIWYQDTLVIIEPAHGEVTGTVDLAPLRQQLTRRQRAGPSNGIAWNKDTQTLYLTGKLWPSIYEVRLLSASSVAD